MAYLPVTGACRDGMRSKPGNSYTPAFWLRIVDSLTTMSKSSGGDPNFSKGALEGKTRPAQGLSGRIVGLLNKSRTGRWAH
jgi:hypothetical protein